jgi:hypothetical protein
MMGVQDFRMMGVQDFQDFPRIFRILLLALAYGAVPGSRFPVEMGTGIMGAASTGHSGIRHRSLPLRARDIR